MHLHETTNRDLLENARCNAAMQNHRQHRRHPEVLAVFGEPRRIAAGLRRSFETPRKRAAPRDDG
jgi:hypothetical protein